MGETGTGKEVVGPRAARSVATRQQAVHRHQLRGPSCSLIESELFGHEAGAFPGAMRARFGKFEHATGRHDAARRDRLDAAGPAGQAAAGDPGAGHHPPGLERGPAAGRALHRHLGRPLEDEVLAGRFRADLLYRLNVVTLHVPPLVGAARGCAAAVHASWCSRGGGAIPPPARAAVPPQLLAERSPSATGRAMCASCATPPTATRLGMRAAACRRCRGPRRRAWPSGWRRSSGADRRDACCPWRAR